MLGETARLCSEAAEVIDLRLRLLWRGGPVARRETVVMVAEKYAAACMLTARLVTGELGTTPTEVTRSTLRFHRRWVRANRRRLAREKSA
ncbi:MAG: hypothetical protein AB7F98_06065 [Novosphingobium sp.]